MSQPNDEYLICSQNHRRPVVCSYCLSTKLKNLRIGINRAKEELQALLQEAVQEIHSDTNDLNLHKCKYLLGTNAALHRVDWADVIFFADYDQELYASGYRSEEIALSNLIRAVRITNARPKSIGQVILQTRSQKNQLIEVIKAGDYERWHSINTQRRKLLSLPPYGSVAEISGPGAKDYVELIKPDQSIDVLGPLEGAWLIKSKSHEHLLKTVSGVPRPKARIRIAVNG
jgi:primosomal protein N' (replication factor Y)